MLYAVTKTAQMVIEASVPPKELISYLARHCVSSLRMDRITPSL